MQACDPLPFLHTNTASHGWRASALGSRRHLLDIGQANPGLSGVINVQDWPDRSAVSRPLDKLSPNVNELSLLCIGNQGARPVDSQHFRKRAAEARALAKLGQDAKLASLLLEVAQDLDAEADVIDAGISRERRDSTRFPAARLTVSSRPFARDEAATNVELLDLSVSGARVGGAATLTVRTKLLLGSCGLGAYVSPPL